MKDYQKSGDLREPQNGNSKSFEFPVFNSASTVNMGTLVYRDEIFEFVELCYYTPAFYSGEMPEVYVWRTRDEGFDTFYTTLVYMVFPDFDISGNSFTFAGMIPAKFEIKEGLLLPGFSDFQYYEHGEFSFYPYYCRKIPPNPSPDSE